MSNAEFGRRKHVASGAMAPASVPADTVPASEPQGAFAEVLTSPLVVKLGGIFVGLIVVFVLAGIYLVSVRGNQSEARNMGRELAKQWEGGKTIQLDMSERSFGERGPCNIRGGSLEFQRVQRELGC